MKYRVVEKGNGMFYPQWRRTIGFWNPFMTQGYISDEHAFGYVEERYAWEHIAKDISREAAAKIQRVIARSEDK